MLHTRTHNTQTIQHISSHDNKTDGRLFRNPCRATKLGRELIELGYLHPIVLHLYPLRESKERARLLFLTESLVSHTLSWGLFHLCMRSSFSSQNLHESRKQKKNETLTGKIMR